MTPAQKWIRGLALFVSLCLASAEAVAAPPMPTGTNPGSTSSPGPTQPSSTVTLSWDAVSGATYYGVGVTNMATGALVVDAWPTGTSYTASLSGSGQYRWNVAACNATGCSSYTTRLYFQTPTPTVSPGQITVTVKRSDTNALLSGATVSLSGGPSSPPSQPTGSDGTSTFSDLAVGNYIVRASLAEYQTNSASATVVANTPTPVPVSLAPSQELTSPPPRVETPVDDTVTPPGGNAVVITHGLNDRATLYDDGTKSLVTEMAEDLCRKLGFSSPFPVPAVDLPTKMCRVNNNNKNWDVWVYDWQNLAKGWFEPTIPYISHNFNPLPDFLPDPAQAQVNAIERGRALADYLKTKNYQHIHFVAHSAGANLIHTATNWLRVWVSREALKIHETFLDAYDSRKELSSYGLGADWADNYVDTRDVVNPDILDGTKLFLGNAYNIDVTTLGIDVDLSLDCLSDDLAIKLATLLAMQAPLAADLEMIARLKVYQYFCRHSRPFRFYGLSITGMGNGSFVGDADHKLSDPIDSTAEMGYPLSVENGLTLEFLEIVKPRNKKCVVQGGLCYDNDLPPSFVQFLWPSTKEVAIQIKTTAVDVATGVGNYIYNSIKMGAHWFTSLAPQQTLAVRESATSGAATDYLVVNVTTTSPVNTLRFNWSFAAAGEGLLRVFVGGNLVSQIDQRYVTPSSPETEEIYIGGEGVPLPPGTHRITFRLDGFGTSASGVELTNVELGLLAVVNPTLTVTKAGTGSGIVTSAPAGIDCGADCSESYASATPVSLTAIPNPGSIFVGWGGNCAADGTVTLDAIKTCTATFTATVVGPLTISTTSPPAGEQGAAYGYALLAEGGTPPYTWSLGGGKKNKLPQGLTLTSDGILGGIPTKAKTATFTVQVTDATYALATKNLSLQIVKGVKFKTKKLKGGTVGTPYSSLLKTKGGIAPLTFSVVGGALPPGLTLDPATGEVSGTPTVAGAFDFVAQVTSSGGSSHQKNIRIKIK